jgi:hypothetical protein
LFLTLVFFWLLFAAVGATRILGAAQAPSSNAFLQRFPDDVQMGEGRWCWFTICPDAIGIEHAAHILRQHGTVTSFDAGRHLEWRSRGVPTLEADVYGYEPQAQVTLVVLDLAPWGITLGEMIRYLGVPALIIVDENTVKATATLCFSHSVCLTLRDQSRLKPHAQVDRLYFLSTQTEQPNANRPLEAAWHGFADIHRCMALYRRFNDQCP